MFAASSASYGPGSSLPVAIRSPPVFRRGFARKVLALLAAGCIAAREDPSRAGDRPGDGMKAVASGRESRSSLDARDASIVQIRRVLDGYSVFGRLDGAPTRR